MNRGDDTAIDKLLADEKGASQIFANITYAPISATL